MSSIINGESQFPTGRSVRTGASAQLLTPQAAGQAHDEQETIGLRARTINPPQPPPPNTDTLHTLESMSISLRQPKPLQHPKTTSPHSALQLVLCQLDGSSSGIPSSPIPNKRPTCSPHWLAHVPRHGQRRDIGTKTRRPGDQL